MIDRNLKSLASLATPCTRETARRQAVSVALETFDAVQEEKTSAETQVFSDALRPTSTLKHMWRIVMSFVGKPIWTAKPATLATATGLLLLPLAAVVTLNVTETTLIDSMPGELVQPPRPAKTESEMDNGDVAGGRPTLEEQANSLNNQATSTLSLPKEAKSQNQAQIVSAPTAVTKTKSQRSIAELRTGLVRQQSKTRTDSQRPRQLLQSQLASTERYQRFRDNAVTIVAENPVSTFSIDVDTASYARVRTALNAGKMPPKDMVRVEELVNYFDYSYPQPDDRSQPFEPTVSITATPWNAHTQLMQIGIKGFDVPAKSRPVANIVMLLDVSGSMNHTDKLPLLIKSFRLFLQHLNPTDTISIVTYAGRVATVLDSIPVSNRAEIFAALENLQAGGSTAGTQGIQQAYRLAEKNFVKGGVNRVMLATDGDFNVGISNPAALKQFIADKRKSGINLSVFGFGRGNYNDALMQALAQNGNGQAAYIDTLAEARKALVENVGGTLISIAGDVKIQVEFNPSKIAEYRLIGYETRALERLDFNNDKVDAGDIGAGLTVTALYELTPVDSPAVLHAPLRYEQMSPEPSKTLSDEVAHIRLRYKLPGEDNSHLLEKPVVRPATKSGNTIQPTDSGFATAVAAFGQKLRGNPAMRDFSYQRIAELANANRGADKFGHRAGFVQLVHMAGALSK
jgi:Ca-activated chloride channel family protein